MIINCDLTPSFLKGKLATHFSNPELKSKIDNSQVNDEKEILQVGQGIQEWTE